MANENILEMVSNYIDQLDPSLIDKFVDNLKKIVPTSTEVFNKLKDSSREAKDSIQSTSNELNDLNGSLEKIKGVAIQTYLENITQKLSAANPNLVSMTTQIGLLAASFSGLLPVSDNLSAIGNAAKDAQIDVSDLYQTLSKIPGAKIPVMAFEALDKKADPARDFESGMLRINAQSGNLNSLLEEVGENLEGMNEKQIRFANLTEQIGNSTGISSRKIGEYASELMKIPGALENNIALEQGSKYINELEAALNVATGTGQSFRDVVEDINYTYQEFNKTGKESLEFVSRIASSSQDLRIPLEEVKRYTKDAGSGFKFFGDNSQAAINILDKFGPALKETGLGNRAVLEITSGAINSIRQMSIAQNAFLSQQTGGKGGLQGAFEIDLLKQQGKLDEVFNKVQQALKKQFGGNIVTLEEGAKDSRASGQLMKEVAFLTEGPTKIANSREEAYKILEAFKKGSTPTETKTGEKALESSINIGTKIQERQYNVLVNIQNELTKAGNLASISAYNLQRIFLGTRGEKNQTMVRDLRERNSEMAGQFYEKINPDQLKDSDNSINESINQSMRNVGKNLNNAKDFIMSIGSNSFNESYKGIKNIIPQNNTPPIINNQQTSSKDVLDINVHTLCEKCYTGIATHHAKKIGRQLIQENESNKAISVHTGTDRGL